MRFDHTVCDQIIPEVAGRYADGFPWSGGTQQNEKEGQRGESGAALGVQLNRLPARAHAQGG